MTDRGGHPFYEYDKIHLTNNRTTVLLYYSEPLPGTFRPSLSASCLYSPVLKLAESALAESELADSERGLERGFLQGDSNMSTERKRGGQPGNRNSRKHGFYSKGLDNNLRREFRRASKMEGLDDEITLLRLNIKSLMDKDPPDLRLVDREARTLAALISARDNLHTESGDDLKKALEAVLSKYPSGLPVTPE